MPNGVVTWSMTLPSLRIVETARYRVGDSGDQSAGFDTAISCAISSSLPGATLSFDCALPTLLPDLSNNVVSTVTPAVPEASFSTRVRTETLADAPVASGVLTKTPQCATCVGSVTTTRTCL